MFPAQRSRKQLLQERNSFLRGKEAESVIKNISDFSINKTFLMRTCLANSFILWILFTGTSGSIREDPDMTCVWKPVHW
jgi:hypothetical protein